MDAESANDTTFFALAVEDSVHTTMNSAAIPPSYDLAWHRLQHMRVWFGNSVLQSGYPKSYLNDGYYPHVAAAFARQDLQSSTVSQSARELVATPTPTIRPS